MASARALTPAEATRWSHIGTLSALAMLLGYAESFIPLPVPGVKLGLANIPVLVALATGDIAGAFYVGLMKVLVTGLLFGNPVTLAYSSVGTLLALCLMAPLSKLPTMRLEMVSVVGALAHELGQLLVAQVILGTPLVWYSAPILAVAGCMTGALCGMVAQRTFLLLEQAAPEAPRAEVSSSATAARQDSTRARAGEQAESGRVRLREALLNLCYLALIVVVMHATSALPCAVCLVLSLIACAVGHMRPRQLAAALAPTLPIVAATLVAQIARFQQGVAVARFGPVVLTQDALAATMLMLARLVCITLASLAIVRLIGRDGLIRLGRAMLRPLAASGIRTEGPELAATTSLDCLARLAEQLSVDFDARQLWTAAFWRDQLPALVVDLYHQADSSCDACTSVRPRSQTK